MLAFVCMAWLTFLSFPFPNANSYGEKYEKIRVLKGYPRVGASVQAELRKEIQDDDFDFLNEIRSFTAIEVVNGVSFLQDYIDALETLALGTCIRLFLVACHFVRRINTVLEELDGAEREEICDNGYFDLKREKTLRKARAMVRCIISTCWPDPESLRKSLLSTKLYQHGLCMLIKDAKKMEASDLRDSLLSL